VKNHIHQLYEIAHKPYRNIIGLMSGTSLDGLDIAYCQIHNSGIDTKLVLKHFITIPYDEDFKNAIRKIFAKRQIDLQDLCILNPYIGLKHGEMIVEAMKQWGLTNQDVDVIASHGQTIFHAPKKQHQLRAFPNSTLQIGDGDHIAVTTGIITLSDFRQKHIATGGEGAPLAVYGDYYLFSTREEDRILLNMGGIANFTYLATDQNSQTVFTTDTGPGNTLIDAYMRRYFHLPFDENGAAAAKGTVNEKLLDILKNHPFFTNSFPKTTGPELFNLDYVSDAISKSGLSTLTRNDVIATLTQFSASTIVDAILKVKPEGKSLKLYASGGGAHNLVLMRSIQALLPDSQVLTLDTLGVPGDAKEAVLFAVLANEAIAGTSPLNPESNLGIPNVSMGKISFPN
jgi:anhydro-N-acetylmuramic acid kinase